MMPNVFSQPEIAFNKKWLRRSRQNTSPTVIQLRIKKMVLNFCVLLVSVNAFSQVHKDSSRSMFQFSGTISLTNNGISPIPAFSLEKPAILGFLSLRKNRFSYDPEMAFSLKGIPWFINNSFRYRLIEKKRFQFRTGLIWGLGFSYPKVMENGVSRTNARAERFFWLELVPRFEISEKVAISSTTYLGYNFEQGSVKNINFISLVGNITNIKLHKYIYSSFYPQVFYLNFDNITDGLFLSVLWGLGHSKLPLFLSMQINQTLSTTISPDPGFKWNVSASYTFK